MLDELTRRSAPKPPPYAAEGPAKVPPQAAVGPGLLAGFAPDVLTGVSAYVARGRRGNLPGLQPVV